MQQFDTDFRLDMDDSFSLCSQTMSCPSASSSFSSASSLYDPFTPNSRRSTPNEISLENESYQGPQGLDMTPPSASKNGFMFGHVVKNEPEPMPYYGSLPSTPMKKIDGFSDEYNQVMGMQFPGQIPMSNLTPSNSFGMNTISPETALGPYMMTPTQSLSGSDSGLTEGGSTWSLPTTESPINFFNLPDTDGLDLDRLSHSPSTLYPLAGNGDSPNRFRAQRKMMLQEAQHRTSELQRAQIRAPRRKSEKGEAGAVDVVRRAMCKCDYPGCNKAFRRNEHLKRHKQTYHGEGPNRFRCEFCGKDQFNRQDNLNNHRKLHARPNSRNRGVEFKPEAVAIIELEERSRKKRAPPKSKMGLKTEEYEF